MTRETSQPGRDLEPHLPPQVKQIAMVVRDIEKASVEYARLFGVDPPEWHLTGASEETDARYRGTATDARAKLAFIQLGNISIELIEPVGAPSIWADFLEKHGEGVHHVAFEVDDMPKAVQGLSDIGFTVTQTGEYTGGRYAYLDAFERLGTDIELLENDAQKQA